MNKRTHLFTSESVSMGHPDKVADQISDAVVDFVLGNDPNPAFARVACETLCTRGLVVVAGEMRRSPDADRPLDLQQVVRETIKEIGYTNTPENMDMGFHDESCGVIHALHSQSPDIARGVDHAQDESGTSKEQGAGDQGMMFGFACDETEDYLPLPIWLSHRIVERQAAMRNEANPDRLKYLRPDAKSQVTVEYENGKPVRVHTVVLSTQHNDSILKNGVVSEDAKREIIEKIIKPTIPAKYFHDKIIYHVNPTGIFMIGGPYSDTGLTGRKIIVDTYGGMGRHGGGAFSGKDPTKVDRSAAYMARYIAKNIVHAGLAAHVEVQLAYAIGIAKPVSVFVDTSGTNQIPEERIAELVESHFPLTPSGIINHLGLLKPIYRPSARHGHFGRKPDDGAPGAFSWEKTDKAESLAKAAGISMRKAG